LSRSNTLLIILAICLVLVMIYLAAGLLQERNVRSRLAAEIETTSRNLRDLPVPDGALSERLEQAKVESQAARQSVSGGNIDPTEIIALLLKTADERHLQLDPLSSEQWAKKNAGTSAYNMLPVELTLTGKASDYYQFVADLENTHLFLSLVIEQTAVIVSYPPAPDSEAVYNARLTISLVERLETAS
jgi:hypothetical protein